MPCESFRLYATLAALEPFNAQVRASLDATQPPPGEAAVSTIFLLLDELLTNVIKYGHPGGDGGGHEIDVRICLEPDGFMIEIEDDGTPFDPTIPPAPPAAEVPWEERPVGGWGLELVRRSVDALEYKRDQSKNKLTLRKYFRLDGDGLPGASPTGSAR